MVAIRDDDLANFFGSHEKERGKLMACENFSSILLHVRIADSQKGQPRSSENIPCLELRHGRPPELLYEAGGDPVRVYEIQEGPRRRIIMFFGFRQPPDFDFLFS